MTILSGIALFALTLAGYAGTAVIAQRIRNVPLGPRGVDTLLLPLVWAGGIGLRLAGLGPGRAILLAVAAAVLLAALTYSLRSATGSQSAGSGEFRTGALPARSPGLWNAWKSFARASGDFQARLLLQLFYFFAIGPFAIIARRSDPMRRRASGPSYWLARPEVPPTIDEARKQG